MCNFFSAIVLRNGDVLWHEATDSHSDLVAHFQLPDNGECRHFAKVEFTPAEKDGVLQYGEPDSYIMRVDEPTCPPWFEDVRGAVETKLRAIIRSMIVADKRPLVLGGCRILVSGCNVDTVKSARIVAMLGTSRVGTMMETSRVGTMRGTSRVDTMRGTSQVGTMMGTSQAPKPPTKDERCSKQS